MAKVAEAGRRLGESAALAKSFPWLSPLKNLEGRRGLPPHPDAASRTLRSSRDLSPTANEHVPPDPPAQVLMVVTVSYNHSSPLLHALHSLVHDVELDLGRGDVLFSSGDVLLRREFRCLVVQHCSRGRELRFIKTFASLKEGPTYRPDTALADGNRSGGRTRSWPLDVPRQLAASHSASKLQALTSTISSNTT